MQPARPPGRALPEKVNPMKRISDEHRNIHRTWLLLARTVRHNGTQHARFMALAARSRFYFATLRSLGE